MQYKQAYSYSYKNRNTTTRNLRLQTQQQPLIQIAKTQKKSQQFITQTQYLQQRLFQPIKPKYGPKTILNMTVLPDYLAYIKQQLTPAQKTVLLDYHLQNLLMEYAVSSQNVNLYQNQQSNHQDPSNMQEKNQIQNHQKSQNLQQNQVKHHRSNSKKQKDPYDTLQKLTSAILRYIRKRNQFWSKKSKQLQTDQKQRQHHAIQTYQSHMKQISVIQSKYSQLKKEQIKNYQTYQPLYQYYKNEPQRLQKIVNDYSYQLYGNLKIDQIANILNQRGGINCTYYPLILQYVIKDIKVIEKKIFYQQQKEEKENKQHQKEQSKQEQENYEENSKEKDNNKESNQKSQKQNNMQQNDQIQNKQKESQSQSQSQQKKFTIIFQFYSNRKSKPKKQIIQKLRQAMIFISLKEKGNPQTSLTTNPVLRDKQRDYSTSKNQNMQISTSLMKWLQKIKGIPKSKLFYIKREWVFYANLLNSLQEILYLLENQQKYRKISQSKIEIQPQANNSNQIDFCKKVLSQSQITDLSLNFLNTYQNTIKFQVIQSILQQKQSIPIQISEQYNPSKTSQKFFQKYAIYSISNYQQIQNLKQFYEEVIINPQNQSLTRYKVTQSNIPWQNVYYQYFLKCLADYIYLPTNNRKIAIQMSKIILQGDDLIAEKNIIDSKKKISKKQSKKVDQLVIEPNHVKYVKGLYFRNMTKRVQNGQCGGGKRGKVLSKQQFIKRDLENFNMKYFKKTLNKHENRSNKKRRRGRKKKGFYDYSSQQENNEKQQQNQMEIQ